MFENILQTIGNTPLVKINNMCSKPGIEIFAKLEGFNPSGSIKDRIAVKMIEQAEQSEQLYKGKTIIEATSGNTGISLAMIGRVLGYKVEIVMSSAVSVERRKMIEAFGGKIILTDENQGTDGAIRECKRRVKENPDKYFNCDQFSNEYNKLAHYRTTAEEIWQQTNGKLTHFVSALGTSGTIMGVGMGLREHNKKIRIIEAQPVEGHYIQGLKNMKEAIVPSIYKRNEIYRHIMIDSEDAFATARDIVAKEGIFVGMSSGAAMLAALKIAEETENAKIVVIFPDRGEKYLSTPLFG